MAVFERMPHPYYRRTEQASRGALLAWLGDYGEAYAAYRECLEFALPIDARAVLATCFDGFAGIAAETGQPRTAAMLFGYGERIRRDLGIALPRVCPQHTRPLEAARAAPGVAGFAAAYAKGLNLDDEHALALTGDGPGTRLGLARGREAC